ncbi:hypothetical protein LI328DRAFT_158939 [Trichoderma asperelloides]|nr:hypothetical protein LI328DRAFT_158939 [Trichoderma asperelloides]
MTRMLDAIPGDAFTTGAEAESSFMAIHLQPRIRYIGLQWPAMQVSSPTILAMTVASTAVVDSQGRKQTNSSRQRSKYTKLGDILSHFWGFNSLQLPLVIPAFIHLRSEILRLTRIYELSWNHWQQRLRKAIIGGG